MQGFENNFYKIVRLYNKSNFPERCRSYDPGERLGGYDPCGDMSS